MARRGVGWEAGSLDCQALRLMDVMRKHLVVWVWSLELVNFGIPGLLMVFKSPES